MSEEEKPPTCDECGGMFYDSPNPQRKGQWEHFCSKTKGMIFRKKGWPKDLSAKETKEFNSERRKSSKGKS